MRISLTSYFAARWLTRRLGRFSALHPEVEIHLHLINGDADFKRTDIDIAIAWGKDDWPDLEARLLMPIRVTPVCSPMLLASGPPLREIADLKHHRLLHEAGQGLWETWLTATGVENFMPKHNIVMDDPNVLHQAAIEGQGIAIGARALLNDEITQGLLIQPFEESVELGGYYIVHPPGARTRANVSAFFNWLISETQTC